MFRQLTRTRTVRYVALIGLGVGLIAVLLVAGGAFRATAQEKEPGVAPNSPLAPTSYACTIATLGVMNNRIHVKCTAAVPATTIIWFASATTDSANAALSNRYLTLLNTAYALGKVAYITYDNNSANNPANCQLNDCRKMLGVDLVAP